MLGKAGPPKNLTEAKALASAGELAVPYLEKRTQYGAPVAAARVRALALLGSDTALDALETYSLDTRQTVIAELLRGWNSFDRESYMKRVLSYNIAMLQYLRLERASFLEWTLQFQDLHNLKMLTVNQYGNSKDLSAISKLTKLTILDLRWGEHVENLGFLERLVNLDYLRLWYFDKVCDLGPLAALTNLKTLNLRSLRQVEDLRPLIGLTSLTHLELAHIEGHGGEHRQTPDLNPLIALPNLRALSL
jgi:hypothetical protein